MLIELRIADTKMKNEKHIVTVYLSESSGDYTPDGWRLFAVSHWMLIDLRIDDPRTKDQRWIISIYLSECSIDYTPEVGGYSLSLIEYL